MSGFDPDWLRLREPADHRARDAGVLNAVAAYFSGRDTLRVLDIGCGLGSNFRALSPLLSQSQHWDLIDHDAHLLHAARDSIGSAAIGVSVQTHLADLATDVPRVLNLQPHLVTAAAFFDLVSDAWISDFVAGLKQRKLPLYAVLTYDGTEQWQPPHPSDAAVLSAFHTHQARDKGFGLAAGPRGHACLAGALRDAGYRMTEGESPWRLDAVEDVALIAALASGISDAVIETNSLPAAIVRDWRLARIQAQGCVIGHRDLFAYL